MNTSPTRASRSEYLAPYSAAALLSIYGALVLSQAAVGPEDPDAAARGDVALAALHFGITLVVALGIRRARSWAWWSALLLVALGLFFLLPIAMGFFLGTGEGPPLGGIWESVFVLSSFAVLVVLGTILVAGRRSLGIERGRRGPGSA